MTITVRLDSPILLRNEEAAREIRDLCQENKIFLVNIMSSPGAGKTTLLEATLRRLDRRVRTAVIEGDLATTRDADRIAALGVPAVQLNTNGACHLDARMVLQALSQLDLANLDLVIVENVGNLVCPAEFDLGESLRVVVLSTTEGNDKVSKYPLIFRTAGLMVLNKVDLLPYTDFSVPELAADTRLINPDLEILHVSARSGDGLDAWVQRLSQTVNTVNAVPS